LHSRRSKSGTVQAVNSYIDFRQSEYTWCLDDCRLIRITAALRIARTCIRVASLPRKKYGSSVKAPVKEARLWPKKREAASSSVISAQLTTTRDLRLREL